MPILKKRFQTMRQILRALRYTNCLEKPRNKTTGCSGGRSPPDANEKERFFKFFRLKNEEARFLRKKFNTYRKFCAFWRKIIES